MQFPASPETNVIHRRPFEAELKRIINSKINPTSSAPKEIAQQRAPGKKARRRKKVRQTRADAFNARRRIEQDVRKG